MKEGKALSEIALPTGWTWGTPNTVTTVTTKTYSARLAIDDVQYDYSGITF